MQLTNLDWAELPKKNLHLIHAVEVKLLGVQKILHALLISTAIIVLSVVLDARLKSPANENHAAGVTDGTRCA